MTELIVFKKLVLFFVDCFLFDGQNKIFLFFIDYYFICLSKWSDSEYTQSFSSMM